MSIADRLLAWHRVHGRHDLPWSGGDAYQVWVSEIMLQQTQVGTVIPYFHRFMTRFPGVHALAAAELEEVLAHWSGLGYYARARNLHAAARQVVQYHGGSVPADLDGLMALPGIGRSTAGAILALSLGIRTPILDGNAKRVLARHAGIEGWTGEHKVEAALWDLADLNTPVHEVGSYTQAIMDLGATVCVRRHPTCDTCPIAGDCVARRAGLTGSLPTPRPRRARPSRHTVMLMLRDGSGATLLERRPPRGVWGGLWSLPQFDSLDDAACITTGRYGDLLESPRRLGTVRHEFTHFSLVIDAFCAQVGCGDGTDGRDDLLWATRDSFDGLGLPAPVRRLLEG